MLQMMMIKYLPIEKPSKNDMLILCNNLPYTSSQKQVEYKFFYS